MRRRHPSAAELAPAQRNGKQLLSAGPPTLAQLTPEQALRHLELTVLRRLDGLLQGDHLGLTPGRGSEPAQVREYQPGEDDVRRMEWAVTARTGVPHVRDDVADRELETHIVVDRTASMDFGTTVTGGLAVEKRDLAVAAVAAVGLLTAGDGNRVGAQVLTGQGVRRVPARSGRPALLGLLSGLLAAPRAEPSGGHGDGHGQARKPATLADAIDGLRRGTRRRGLAVVVTDFLSPGGAPDPGEPWDWEQPLRRLAVRSQVLAIEVVDPRELELPDVGLLAVVDPETGRRREVWTGSRRLRERYAEAAADQRAQVRVGLRRAGAAHLQLRTGRDWVRDMARFVRAGRRGARRPAVPAAAPTGLPTAVPTARPTARPTAPPATVARHPG